MSDTEGTPVMQSISDALGMAPLIVDNVPVAVDETPETGTELVVATSAQDAEAEEDFALVRKNSQELLGQAQEALDGILRIAASSEHPRAFEVAANLLKTASELNAGLLKLHETRRQLVPDTSEPKEAPKNVTNVQNNFYGSTQDFLDMIEARERAAANVIDGEVVDAS